MFSNLPVFTLSAAFGPKTETVVGSFDFLMGAVVFLFCRGLVSGSDGPLRAGLDGFLPLVNFERVVSFLFCCWVTSR